jgi:hypothetical protein
MRQDSVSDRTPKCDKLFVQQFVVKVSVWPEGRSEPLLGGHQMVNRPPRMRSRVFVNVPFLPLSPISEKGALTTGC